MSFMKFAAAAVMTLSMASAANAAELVNVGTSNSVGGDQIKWDSVGGGSGTLSVTNLVTGFNFDDALVNDGFLGQVAVLNLVATSAPGSALLVNGPTFAQTGLDGFFEFRLQSNPSIVLLRGDFTGMWLNGKIGDTAGSAMTVLTGGSLQLTSAVVDLDFLQLDNAAFSFSNVHPAYSIAGGELADFQGNSLTGTFGGAIPEPGTWALMIMGFGGAGALLRSRRRTAFTVA